MSYSIAVKPLNIQAIKAMLKSENFKSRMAEAFTNVFYNGFSVDHIKGANNYNVLSIRIRNGKLRINDRTGADITELYMAASC